MRTGRSGRSKDPADPGTLSFVLEPVGDFRPSFDPDAAVRELGRARAGLGVTITLATVYDTDFGTTWGPGVGAVRARRLLRHLEG